MVLIYNKDIGSALRKACEHDADDDAIHLAKAAKIVRRDMFKLKNKFNGSFAPHCQERSVPTSLLSPVAMVLCGPSIEIQSSTTLSQPILTISQLLMHNSLDTDVVVLAVASAQWLDLDELWIAFGVGKNFRFFAAHEIAKTLGLDQLFHAFTGCDTVSFFGGKGKKTAWNTWKAYKEVTPAFCALAAKPSPQTIQEWLGLLERFVILLYDRSSSQECVNQARKQLFTQKGRAIENLPPTHAALTEHIKRAAYQAGYCWAQMAIKAPELPSPNEWGWKKADEGWEAQWTTLPEAAQACRELIKCSCKKSCTGRCKCKKSCSIVHITLLLWWQLH